MSTKTSGRASPLASAAPTVSAVRAARSITSAGASCSKSVEIWNLVFTQFNLCRARRPITCALSPRKNIDTGMGPRANGFSVPGKVCPATSRSTSLRLALPQACGRRGRRDSHRLRYPCGRAALRRDGRPRPRTGHLLHSRRECSPGSEKESYVVRQLLRRALLEGYLLGKHEPFLHTARADRRAR